MNREWQKDLEIRSPAAAASLPPAMVEETGWDILLALYSEPRLYVSIEKLAALTSVPRVVLNEWLGWLEDRGLVASARDKFTGEFRVELSSAGEDLLDRYLSSVSRLQAGTRH